MTLCMAATHQGLLCRVACEVAELPGVVLHVEEFALGRCLHGHV